MKRILRILPRSMPVVAALAGASMSWQVHAQSADTEVGSLDEVVITAEKREDTLQKSSLAIEVFSAEALQRAAIMQATDITAAAPGVQVGSGGALPQIYIRGIGDYGATSVSNPAIAFNVDGVYIARPTAVAGNFFDLARMEVLKGPQGTLYGRNASGGAINLVPALPELGRIGGYFELGAQNYSGKSGEFAFNLPIGEVAALRLSGQGVERDGYLSGGENDDRHQSVRVQLLFKPGDRFDARLWGSYSHAGGHGTNYALYNPTGVITTGTPGNPDLDPWTSIASAEGNAIIAAGNTVLNMQRCGGSPAQCTPAPWLDPFDPATVHQDISTYNAHAEINWHADWATLTVIPAYQSTSSDYHAYPGLSYAAVDNAGNPETSYATSLEARLSNNGERVKWVAGGFYYDENQNSRSTIDNGFIQRLFIIGTQSTESYAAFGQTTIRVTDPLRVIAGLRYTHEDKSARFDRYNLVPSSECFFGGAPGTPTACFNDTLARPAVTDSATNYRAGIEYDLAAQNMLFATVTTGFKAGGINQANADPFKSEKLTAYTIGSRNRFLGDTLQVNLEGFYYDYNEHQEFVVGTDLGGEVGAFVVNAGDATSYGASVDVTWAPLKSDQFRVAAEYLHARYDSFVYTQPTFTIAATGCSAAVDPSLGVRDVGGGVLSPVSRIDCSGREMIRAPTWSGLASYNHTFDLEGGGAIDAGVDMTYASARWLSVDFVGNVRAAGYTVWNGDVSYTTANDRMQITAFVKNASDEAVYTGASQNSWLGGFVGANIGAPRTYGVRLRVSF